MTVRQRAVFSASENKHLEPRSAAFSPLNGGGHQDLRPGGPDVFETYQGVVDLAKLGEHRGALTFVFHTSKLETPLTSTLL